MSSSRERFEAQFGEMASTGALSVAWNAWQARDAEVAQLQDELERERIRLAACGCVATADTPESAANARQMHDDFKSASCDDVARRVDECIRLRAEVQRLVDALRLMVTSRLHDGVLSHVDALLREYDITNPRD